MDVDGVISASCTTINDDEIRITVTFDPALPYPQPLAGATLVNPTGQRIELTVTNQAQQVFTFPVRRGTTNYSANQLANFGLTSRADVENLSMGC